MLVRSPFHRVCTQLTSFVRTISSNQNGKFSSKIEEKPAEIDFSQAIADFQKNGMAILPIKIDPSFLNESKELCLSAWKDALHRARIIKGNDRKSKGINNKLAQVIQPNSYQIITLPCHTIGPYKQSRIWL